jgi:hypothetical protein
LNDHTLANPIPDRASLDGTGNRIASIRMIFSAFKRQLFSVYAAAFAANCCILAGCESLELARSP